MKTVDLTPMIKRSSASEIVFDLPCRSDERVFFNGYQTWTSSYELRPDDIIAKIHPFFRAIGRPCGIDRFGDDFFIKRSGMPGEFHGFTYFYKRSDEKYLLIASTDETNGYTIFNYSFSDSELTITKDAGIPSKFDPGLHIAAFEGSHEEVFDAWFEASGINRRPAEPMSGYGSWYNRYSNINDKTITEDLEGCAKVLEPGDLFQIDDGWQKAVGDWTENPDRFPRGMKASVDDIHSKGFKAGLWLAPFSAQASSALVKEHPGWLLTHNGKPWYAGLNWGGFYSLDIDNPEVREHLRKVFDTVFNDWGFDLVKLDFLYSAAPWMTVKGPYFGESRGGRMCRAMRYLREWCGDGMILGCGVPLGPAFGQVEYCRIGCDASLNWDGNAVFKHVNREYPSTRNAILNAYYRRGLDGRAFLSDPDVFFLRKSNIKLSEEEKDLHAKVMAQYGSFFLTSDNMGEYSEEQLARYKQLREIWETKSWADRNFLNKLK